MARDGRSGQVEWPRGKVAQRRHQCVPLDLAPHRLAIRGIVVRDEDAAAHFLALEPFTLLAAVVHAQPVLASRRAHRDAAPGEAG